MDIQIDMDKVKEALEPSGEALPKEASVGTLGGEWIVRTPVALSEGQMQTALIEVQQSLVAQKKRELVVGLDRAVQGLLGKGFESSALGKLHTYDLHIEDQNNLSAAVQIGLDAPIRCKGQDESFKSYKVHTKAQLEEVFSAGMAHKSKVLNFFGAQKAQVEAMQDYPSLLAFQIQELED
ncbi:hypothetical protein [Helicobacter felis]|uniref:hypothetical protein n=1 Tax=Helicobacter felis TaxID=214 RepID=UPI000CF026E8|nr:hypothetical protein [Helicobacter felis]